MIIKLLKPLGETLLLTFIPLILAIFFGLIIGIFVYITSSDGLIRGDNKLIGIIHRVSDFLINLFRAIPYMILLIWVIPLAKMLMGTMLGVKGAIPSLVISATPFFARMCIIAFTEVDKGTVEAAKALGASTLDVIFKVYIPESLPALVSSICVTAINLVSYSTMAGAIGAGGLGFSAYNEGFLRSNTGILLGATVLILIIVFAIQLTGDKISKAIDKR